MLVDISILTMVRFIFVMHIIDFIDCDCSLHWMEPSTCRGQISLMLISALIHQELITGCVVFEQLLVYRRICSIRIV